MRTVRVTTTTEVIENDVAVTLVTRVTEEKGVDNPAFVTRAAFRRAQDNADATRVMLGVTYFEPEEEWKRK